MNSLSGEAPIALKVEVKSTDRMSLWKSLNCINFLKYHCARMMTPWGEKMNIEPPSLTEIKKAASDLYFDMDESEISEYSEFMDGLIAGVNLVESLDEPKLPTKYPRGELIRPTEKENRYNAWFWKCSIKGKSEGKLAGKAS